MCFITCYGSLPVWIRYEADSPSLINVEDVMWRSPPPTPEIWKAPHRENPLDVDTIKSRHTLTVSHAPYTASRKPTTASPAHGFSGTGHVQQPRHRTDSHRQSTLLLISLSSRPGGACETC
ncbi:hypothetical protein BS50DRAFT_354135 [Corynespora cassiicola Philippines]|uniref:Uncharacterized protein n=1 Tax=Corynespora cassiicola Philippines TaxID=1448308 RepID=A0A2T2NRG1_CORCC|nr:hypothetical protein BS50DRAFT_354135 [Corynespora cassiicola Philippines]